MRSVALILKKYKLSFIYEAAEADMFVGHETVFAGL